MNGYRSGSGWAEGALDIYGTWIHLSYSRNGLRRNRTRNPNLVGLHAGGGWVQDSIHDVDGSQHIWVHINLEGHDSFLGLADTVAHEAFHAAEAISRFCSIPLKDEPGAYLVGYLTGWVLSQLPKELWPKG